MLTVVRPITVKVIVTEALKDKLALDMQQALQRLDSELQQIEAQSRKIVADMEKANPERARMVKGQLEAEKQKRNETRRELIERIKAVAALEVGQEQVHSTVEGIANVKVGDIWQSAVEIVIKDDRIVEIR